MGYKEPVYVSTKLVIIILLHFLDTVTLSRLILSSILLFFYSSIPPETPERIARNFETSRHGEYHTRACFQCDPLFKFWFEREIDLEIVRWFEPKHRIRAHPADRNLALSQLVLFKAYVFV